MQRSALSAYWVLPPQYGLGASPSGASPGLKVSYGGLLGQVILGTPTLSAISRTALLVLAGVALAYPSTLPLLVRTAWYCARLVWRLGLHRHTWHGIRWIAVMSVQLARRRTTGSRTNNVVIEDDPSLYDGYRRSLVIGIRMTLTMNAIKTGGTHWMKQ